MSRPTPSSKPQAGSADDPFRYGWRYVKRIGPDGQVEWDQVPLTLEDTLHPEEEDVIPVRRRHALQCRYLVSVFQSRKSGKPIVLVTDDLRIDWGVAGIRPHSPDLAVFWELGREPNLDDGTMYLAQTGGRCVLALEVVSPDRRDNDVVHKFRHYHQIGIPLYVIIDQEVEGGPQTLLGYRWTPARYEPLALDDQGRLYLEPVRLYLLLRGDELVCQDAETGKDLGSYEEVVRQLDEADRKLEEKEHQMEDLVEKHHIEIRQRAKAEEQARLVADACEQERLAREQAEKQAWKAEEQARKAADARQQERLARERAEEDARREKAGRESAEEQIRQLHELLARLQGQSPQTGAGSS